MSGDTILTGSDDWTARVWSLNRGSCEAVLACHAGPIISVEYSPSDRGIITGSYFLAHHIFLLFIELFFSFIQVTTLCDSHKS